MLQNLRALLLLILALPGLTLAPGSAFVVCLCDGGAAEPVTTGCCQGTTATQADADMGCGACDGAGLGLGCCGNPEDCDGCLEIELDDLLLATFDGPEAVIHPPILIGPAMGQGRPEMWALQQGHHFLRPPPPDELPTAGLLPGDLPLRI